MQSQYSCLGLYILLKELVTSCLLNGTPYFRAVLTCDLYTPRRTQHTGISGPEGLQSKFAELLAEVDAEAATTIAAPAAAKSAASRTDSTTAMAQKTAQTQGS